MTILDDISKLEAQVKELKHRGNKIVLAYGDFDVFHAGHLRCLKAAGELGDVLIVAVTDDDGIRDTEGEGFPLVPQEERVAIVDGMEVVDFSVLTSITGLRSLIELIEPDSLALISKDIPQLAEWTNVAEKHDGKVVMVGEPDGNYSSREIVEMICRKTKGLD